MLLSTSTLAQNEEELQDPSEVPETQVNESEIEQIIVQGERTTFALRMEIQSAETEEEKRVIMVHFIVFSFLHYRAVDINI